LALLGLGTSALTGCDGALDYTTELKFGTGGIACFKTNDAFVLGHLNAKVMINEDANVVENAVAITASPGATYKVEVPESEGKNLKLYTIPAAYAGNSYIITKSHTFDAFTNAPTSTNFIVIGNITSIEKVQNNNAKIEYVEGYNKDELKIFNINAETGDFNAKIEVTFEEQFEGIFEFAGLFNGNLQTSSEFSQLPNLNFDKFGFCKEFKAISDTLTLTDNKVCVKTDSGFVFQTSNVKVIQQISGEDQVNESTGSFAFYPIKDAYYVLEYVEPASRKSLETTEIKLFELPEVYGPKEGLETKYFIVTKSMEFDVKSYLIQKERTYQAGSQKDEITVISDKATVIVSGLSEGAILSTNNAHTDNVFTIDGTQVLTFSIAANIDKDGTFNPSAHVKVEIDAAQTLNLPEFSGYLTAESNKVDETNIADKTTDKPEQYTAPPIAEGATPPPEDPDEFPIVIVIVVVVVVVLIVAGVLVYFLVFRKKSDSDPEKKNIDNDEENGEELKKGEVFLGVDEKKDGQAANANKDEFAL